MKQIPLKGDGGFALVDDEDYERFSKLRWQNKHGYVVRNVWKGGKCRTVIMHREILTGCRIVDHIDRNGLNNQRSNLRAATLSNNAWNARARKNATSTSIYKGVRSEYRKWRASIGYHWQTVYLGLFDSEIEAACAYDIAAIRLHGEFARGNFIHDIDSNLLYLAQLTQDKLNCVSGRIEKAARA